jgi:hypothetical protein
MLNPEKGGMGIMDIIPFWMAAKIGWLGKILQKDYLEEKKTNNIHHQPIEHDTNKDTETEDWLKL